MTALRMAIVAAAMMFAAHGAKADTVGLGTMSQGTLSFSTGSVIAKVLNQKAGLEARVQPNTGETVLIPLVNQGELDFGIANVLEGGDAYNGEFTFSGLKQEKLRIAAVLYPLRVAFFVKADSETRTIAGLRGKRVVSSFSAMGSLGRVAGAVMANGGVAQGDIVPVPVPNVIKGAEQFLNGRADMFFFAVGAAKVAEVHASVKIRVLPLSDAPEAVARMHGVFASSYLAKVPPLPNFAGVTEPTNVLAYDNLLLTATHVPAETVVKVLETLAGNKDDLIAGFPLFRGLDPDKLVKQGMPLPFHDGAIAWSKSR
ncbi:MAG: TAXI family TRAP transporter solute-binding subunit [Hyphomicrobiales bacterium]